MVVAEVRVFRPLDIAEFVGVTVTGTLVELTFVEVAKLVLLEEELLTNWLLL